LATLVGINYYGWNLDIGDFCRNQLLWLELGHRQLWPEAATMAETSLGFFFFLLFHFFNKRELGGWYLLVEETTAMRHVILTKRKTHVGVKDK